MVAATPHAISSRMTPSDWAQLLLLSLIWGGSFFLTGIAVKGLPVLTLDRTLWCDGRALSHSRRVYPPGHRVSFAR